jgi:hypothetical protein
LGAELKFNIDLHGDQLRNTPPRPSSNIARRQIGAKYFDILGLLNVSDKNGYLFSTSSIGYGATSVRSVVTLAPMKLSSSRLMH